MSHGFNDWNVMPEHSYRIYKKAKAMGLETGIYYHQYGHGGPPPVSMMNTWFTHYLHGVDNGIQNKTNKAWIVREDENIASPTAYKDYPNPEASNVKLYLTPGAPKTGHLSIAQAENQGRETLIDNYSFSGETLAQAEITNHRLLYLTPKLSEAIHISGLAQITIKLSSSKPAANLSVWLVSLPWNTENKAKLTDNIITRGWADPQNYKSLTKSDPLKPGKFYELTFDLQPDDQIIKAGQQIGLMIFSSDRDYTLHPKPGTELTIDLDHTPSTPLKTYIDQLENKDLTILIPGAGNAYEAEYLFNQGFKHVHILDISAAPLEAFQKRVPEFPKKQIIQGDFFTHKNTYDLILEQTFFCSFPPTASNREHYASKMHDLITTNGKLVGLWFNFPLTGDMEKRPFGGDKQDYLNYLTPFFNVISFESCYNSIPARMKNELFGIFQKK